MQDIEQQILFIYEQYYLDIYQFLLYYTGNRSEAEDLTQEVFFRLLKALPTFNGRAELKTWIFSIARFVAIDNYRKQKIARFLSSDWLKKLPEPSALPEDIYESKETKHELLKAINSLKPAYRLVIYLRGIKELSIKEAAEILGCSESKVKTDFSRGLKQLQKKVKPHDWGGLRNELIK